MLRAFIVTTLAITLLASEADTQSSQRRPGLYIRPAGDPTAWVTAKDLSRITLSPGGNGSNVVSCINRGTAGGTFSAAPIRQPSWYDDGFVGAGHPYFWFIGTDGYPEVNFLTGSLPSSTYITHDAYTIYIVMYAHVLESNETDPDNIEANPSPITLPGTGLAVRSGDGGMAILHNAYWPNHPFVDFVEAPITSGDAMLHVWKLEHGGGVLSLSVDGGIPFTVASGSTNGLTSSPIIGFNGTSFPDGAFYGAICEWIFYDRTLSARQDAINMAYLRSEWDTP